MDAVEIIEVLKGQYLEVRILPDGTVAAVCELLTTRSVLLGCDEHSFKRQFCFADRDLASDFFQAVTSENEVPQGGYVARRPESEDRADPYLNDLHDHPWNKVFEN